MADEKELLEKVKAEAKKSVEEELNAAKKDAKEATEAVEELKEELEVKGKEVEEARKDLDQLALDFKALKEKAKTDVEKKLVDLVKEKAEELKAFKQSASKGGTPKSIDFGIVTKGTQGASDIGDRDYLSPFEPGIEKRPVRRTTILDLFQVDSMNSEYLHYMEEDVITRDAGFVVACATSTHNTKKTWVKRTIELAKIRDIIDVCIDMLEDYGFIESEIRFLINESIQLKKENELLLGASANPTDMLSIDSISSEFNPANPLADFSASFQDANLEQLADAMAGQITVFGQENKWMPNVFLMSFVDFVKYRNLKDANGNKLIHTLSDNIPTIAGMRVVTNPLIPSNTCYSIDTTQGRIKQRKGFTLNMSKENKDNIEHELATFVAYERVQFHVRQINRDAFMKCSDITTALAAITKP